MIPGIVFLLVVLAPLVLWARALIRSRGRWSRRVGWIAWLGAMALYVSFVGGAAITRLDCDLGGPSGWYVMQWGHDDICSQRTLFEVLF